MNNVVIPKYMKDKLIRISKYSNEIGKLLQEFEDWCHSNTDEDFSIDLLRACVDDFKYEQTEALTMIEYGGYEEQLVNNIERILTLYKETKCIK